MTGSDKGIGQPGGVAWLRLGRTNATTWLLPFGLAMAGALLVLAGPDATLRGLDQTPLREPVGLLIIAMAIGWVIRRSTRLRGTGDRETLAMRDLAGGVAHEFNNLLTVLSFDGEILANRAGDDPDLRALSVSVLQSCRQGTELTQILLSFAGRQPLDRRRVDMAAELVRMRPSLAASLSAGQTLEFECRGASFLMLTDPRALELCLRHLVARAAAVSDPKGRITLSLANDASPLGSRPATAEIAISYCAAGAGGADARIPRPPGRQDARLAVSSNSRRSHYLDMALPAAEGFARQCGGRLAITDRDGRGTRVTLILPIEQTMPAPAAPAPSPEPLRNGLVPPSQPARVLVVDDNEEVRASLVRRLQTQGHDVVAVGDALHARQLLDTGVDALVTDVVLDGAEDGVALGVAARSRDVTMALVFISGVMSSRQPGLLAGDDLASFVRKPIDSRELAAVLDGLLAIRAMRRGN